MEHEKNKFEASTPKETKIGKKSKQKKGWNKKKSTNGKSKLEWLEISDTLE